MRMPKIEWSHGRRELTQQGECVFVSQSQLLNKGTLVPVKPGFEVSHLYFVFRPAG